MIYEELPDRPPDGSSIDRKCLTIEIKKKRSTRVLDRSAPSMSENKVERRKPKSAREGQKRGRTLFSLLHRENHERTYPPSEIRIELKSWPSQLKRFAKVQEILSGGKKTVGFLGAVVFSSPITSFAVWSSNRTPLSQPFFRINTA